MKINFDEVIDRNNTDSVKYDEPAMEMNNKDFIPMWVADMDFKTPSPILKSIQNMLDKGVLGYTMLPSRWHEAIKRWTKNRYNWIVEDEEIIFTPGIVRGIAFAIQCFSQPEDKILVMSPVYPPFFNVPIANNRKVTYNSLFIDQNHEFQIDFKQFEKDIQGAKLFILCNPHNPGGKVWEKEELQKIAHICKENGVLIISDEIHADLTLPPHQHHAFATVSTEAEQNSIVFMSPSKAFNMPGLASSYCIIKDKKRREEYQSFVEALDVTSSHMFAYCSLIAAYNECSDWLPQLLEYIQGNINYVSQLLKEKMPRIKMIKPEASYLIFLDCRELGLADNKLDAFFKEEAGLILNPGISFGKGGSGFMRLNVGCPKPLLEKAMNQLIKAYQVKF